MTEKELLVIGAGPAGCSAAIYAVRSGVKTMIAGGAMPGGQLLQTNDLENYAGFENPVGGFELMTAMHKQCKRLGVEILTDKIVKIEGEKTPFILTAESGEQYEIVQFVEEDLKNEDIVADGFTVKIDLSEEGADVEDIASILLDSSGDVGVTAEERPRDYEELYDNIYENMYDDMYNNMMEAEPEDY